MTYVYDAVGNLLRMTDSLGVTLYGYDALHRDTSVLYGSGHQLTYALDAAGRRTKMTDPDGGETTYLYDDSNRLTQLTNPQGEVTQFIYDKLDRVTQKTLANGVIETHFFDEVGRETKVEQRSANGAVLSSFVSTYDNVNQRTSVTEADGSVMVYTYDADGQLLSETRTGTHPYSIAYAYDEVGNRLSKVENGSTTTYAYNVGNELVSQETRNSSHAVVSQGTSAYDQNGNVTVQTQDGQITSFTWNPQNYLMQQTAPDGSRESYAYCGEGIRRTVTNNAGLRRFIRDGKNILLEADGNGDTVRRYTHMGEMWGELISLHGGSTSRYYGFDGSANTRLLTDENAGVSDAYLYSAFGEELQISGNSANPLRFCGEVGYYRDDAKHVYVRARHLDVGDGRWLSRDPIGFEGGINFYEYAGNNPLSRIDPSGLQDKGSWYYPDPFVPIDQRRKSDYKWRAPNPIPGPGIPAPCNPEFEYGALKSDGVTRGEVFYRWLFETDAPRRVFGPEHQVTRDVMAEPTVTACYKAYVAAGRPASFPRVNKNTGRLRTDDRDACRFHYGGDQYKQDWPSFKKRASTFESAINNLVRVEGTDMFGITYKRRFTPNGRSKKQLVNAINEMSTQFLLGSYHVTITSETSGSARIRVLNTSSWESATRIPGLSRYPMLQNIFGKSLYQSQSRNTPDHHSHWWDGKIDSSGFGGNYVQTYTAVVKFH